MAEPGEKDRRGEVIAAAEDWVDASAVLEREEMWVALDPSSAETRRQVRQWAQRERAAGGRLREAVLAYRKGHGRR